tara:strand:- start:137 stop:925 length:789 start_codon:yes stop_codon:yes gene_type:complete
MQLLPRYLVEQTTILVADVAGYITEYRPVYNRDIEVYKGIDNALQFRLLNADQKGINLSAGYTVKFCAYDETDRLVIEKNAIIQDDGSTISRGKFKVNITENELKNLQQQFLSYVVYLIESDGDKVLTYSQSNFKNNGTIFVNSKTFPGPLNTVSVTSLTETGANTSIWMSEAVNAEPAVNGNEALHTAAFYTSSFVGDIVVQATLDNQVTDSSNWADIRTVTLDGTEAAPTAVNFYGVFSYIRFKTTANPANKITQILVRN